MTENDKWNLFIGRKVLVIMLGARSVETALPQLQRQRP